MRNDKAIRLSGECMYTLARCMGIRGRPLAMSATIKLEEHLRRPSLFNGYLDRNWRGWMTEGPCGAVPNCIVRLGIPKGHGHGSEPKHRSHNYIRALTGSVTNTKPWPVVRVKQLRAYIKMNLNTGTSILQ